MNACTVLVAIIFLPPLVEAGPLEELTLPLAPQEAALFDEHLAALHDHLRQAADPAAFVAGIVDVHMMRLRREHALYAWIEDDDVGVRPGCDGSLTRIEPEHPGRCGGDQLDEAVEAYAALLHTAIVDQREAVLDPRQAVGDLGEIALAQYLLFAEMEGAVVGRHQLQVVLEQALPEVVLVRARPQRRRADVLGALEAGTAQVVEAQI